MTSDGLPESRAWSRRRWWGMVALVLTFQLACIFWLADRQGIVVRPAPPGPTVRLAGRASAELLALTDPTLFALPHEVGFSGRAWMRPATQEQRPFVWTAPPSLLPLPEQDLGAAFRAFAATNQNGTARILAQAPPKPSLPTVARIQVGPRRSMLRLTGELAGRRLLTQPELSSQPSAELLTNSVVQAAVDADGRVGPAVVLTRSGSTQADQDALHFARQARFEPLPAQDGGNSRRQTWGSFIFEWHTVPLPATNSLPAAKPSSAE